MSKYLAAMKKYADFSGRSSRSEYWFFILFFLLLFIVGAVLDSVFGTFNVEAGIGVVSGLVSVAHIIPGIAVGVRRLHDWEKSGWWYLITLIPLIGLIFAIVLGCIRGTQGPNRYGADPLPGK